MGNGFQVALYSGSIARQGNPSPWSIRPYFGKAFTQDMNFVQRCMNAGYLMVLEAMHWVMITGFLQSTLRKYLGNPHTSLCVSSLICNFWLILFSFNLFSCSRWSRMYFYLISFFDFVMKWCLFFFKIWKYRRSWLHRSWMNLSEPRKKNKAVFLFIQSLEWIIC